MDKASKLVRISAGIGVAVTVAVVALPSPASASQATKGRPSAKAIAAWSATYRAKERVYRAQLAGRSGLSSLPSQAAIDAWSDRYRAMAGVYQQQELAAAQRRAGAFHFGDAAIGGGIVLALVALGAAGLHAVRGRLATVSSS